MGRRASVLEERNGVGGAWGAREGGRLRKQDLAYATTRCLVVCWRGSNDNAYLQLAYMMRSHDALLCQCHSVA